MPDVEVVQERHSMESSTSDETEAAGNYERGKKVRLRALQDHRRSLETVALFPFR